MSPRGHLSRVVAATLLGLILAGCGDDGPVGLDEEVPEAVVDLSLNAGSIGVVIDAREIFKKGYAPAAAEIRFQDHAALDTTLEIDPVTNVAILSIPNDSLTQDQKAAFAHGVAATIVVRDESDTELATYSDDRLVVDDSNRPLELQSELGYAPRPVVMQEGKPYLLQVEEFSGELVWRSLVDGRHFFMRPYDPFLPDRQHFYFTPATGADTYVVGISFDGPEGVETRTFCVATDGQNRYLELQQSCADRAELTLAQDADGWVRLKLQSTGEYVACIGCSNADVQTVGGELNLGDPDPHTFEEASRFRAISDNIDWTISDRGTHFNQPIMPPARLDFAYQATLTNCSAATLTETIGRTQTRTRTTTFGTSESLQLFSGTSIKLGTKIGAETGVSVKRIGKVNITAEVSREIEFSTSLTYQTGNTFEESTSVTETVSRTRDLTVPQYTAVEVSDFVRTIENVITPFAQVFRIRARYKDDGTVLSGSAIATQIQFNFFGGVISHVGADYVDTSIRGEAVTDRFFEAETSVTELAGACG